MKYINKYMISFADGRDLNCDYYETFSEAEDEFNKLVSLKVDAHLQEWNDDLECYEVIDATYPLYSSRYPTYETYSMSELFKIFMLLGAFTSVFIYLMFGILLDEWHLSNFVDIFARIEITLMFMSLMIWYLKE